MEEWIDCTNTMPSKEEYVIVCNAKQNTIFIGKKSTKYKGYSFEDVTGSLHMSATHWMPLPKLPEEQLKSCPFCGFVGVYFGTLNDGHWVKCSHCGCRTKEFNTKYEAGKQWNKRCNNG